MKTRVFVGSSTEGLQLAEAMQRLLDYKAYCTVWPQAVFTPSSVTIDALLEQVRKNDCGIFILSPDDVASIRKSNVVIPRDNVFFEAGMILGRYGKEKALLVAPRDVSGFHLPSDLLGVTIASYDSQRLLSDKADATLGAAASSIMQAIQAISNHGNSLKFAVSHNVNAGVGLYFPSKLLIEIYNTSSCDVVLKPLHFHYTSGLPWSPKVTFLGNDADRNIAYKFPANNGQHTRESVYLVTTDSTNTFAPIDPVIPGPDVQKAIATETCGELHMMCYWIDDNPRMQYYVKKL
jgi:hypothetical protein